MSELYSCVKIDGEILIFDKDWSWNLGWWLVGKMIDSFVEGYLLWQCLFMKMFMIENDWVLD
jgi:hypothetical protein